MGRKPAQRPLWLTALILGVGVVAYLLSPRAGPTPPPGSPRPAEQARTTPGPEAGHPSDGGIERLFREKASDRWVEAQGTVERLLSDENDTADGSDRHQRFLVRLGTGVTVLIAHNIDAARRVPIAEGDPVRFRGEYEWTEKGGTVHFTHAPKHQRRDPGGWIEHAGVRYE